jgi:palmitoyltransferase ZDHHC13/17
VVELEESRQYSALSFCAFKNHSTCFKTIYEHGRSVNKCTDLQTWADRQTDEGFTALHFATYHSNFELIRILVDQMDASCEIKNRYGANVLHIAAQGDAATPLYYFVREKNMDLEEVDNKGSTPLHWACYSKSEFALSYILAMNPNLNARDNAGFTALHLAVKSVEQLQSTRPVRALLLKGARRDAKSS